MGVELDVDVDFGVLRLGMDDDWNITPERTDR